MCAHRINFGKTKCFLFVFSIKEEKSLKKPYEISEKLSNNLKKINSELVHN